jgi:enoyl-CoA hydratase
MSYTTLQLAQNEAVLTITVNRPEVLNAQNRIMLEEFDHAMTEAAENDAVKVVIVAGAGQHFSAGHDIGSPQEKEDQRRRPYVPGLPG